MIPLGPGMRILLAIEPVDFRKGIDGLARVCRDALESNPFSGYVFIFRNRRGTSIKVLVYDGQGFWLCQKRLSSGKFKSWSGILAEGGEGATKMLESDQAYQLFWNNLITQPAIRWRKIGEKV